MLRKLGKNYQIAIPREIIRELGLNKEDHNALYLGDPKEILINYKMLLI
ncbi:MAG: AbrB/MazE/SpoVT family DNA-binding domain-containing protein [Candidatus Humimicrobiaceae bacterium]